MAMQTPVLSAPVLRTPVLADPVLETPILRGPILRGPILQGPILADPVLDPATLFARYKEALLGGQDVSPYLAQDVTWNTMATGEVVEGRESVAALFAALLDRPFKLHRSVAFGQHALCEGVYLNVEVSSTDDEVSVESAEWVSYCAVYDVSEQGITAVRMFG